MKEREFEPNIVTELEVLRLKLTENGGVNLRVDGSWRGVTARDFMVRENCWDLEWQCTRPGYVTYTTASGKKTKNL